MKISWISPWVSRIDWCEGHWFCSTHMAVRLANVSSKTGKKCIFCVFRPFLSLCRPASRTYGLSKINALRINQLPILRRRSLWTRFHDFFFVSNLPEISTISPGTISLARIFCTPSLSARITLPISGSYSLRASMADSALRSWNHKIQIISLCCKIIYCTRF